jgi:hypothetical protein
MFDVHTGPQLMKFAFAGVSANLMIEFVVEHQSFRHVFSHICSCITHSCKHNKEYSHQVAAASAKNTISYADD